MQLIQKAPNWVCANMNAVLKTHCDCDWKYPAYNCTVAMNSGYYSRGIKNGMPAKKFLAVGNIVN